MEKVTKLGNSKVGFGQPCFIICEGGVTNYGQIDLAKKQAEAAYLAGADIVKFQLTKTEKLVSKKVSKRLEKELGYNWFDRMKYKEFSPRQIKEIFDYSKKLGIDVFATAHDDESLEYLDKSLKQKFFKVGSGEAHNYEFIKNIAKRHKPVIISFGIQTDLEVIKAISTLKNNGVKDIIVLHCVSMYPTPYTDANLMRMEHLRRILKLPVGISDHSVGWHIPLAAVAMGACVVEKHITFDKKDPRSLDNPGALLPEEFKIMVSQIRDIEMAKRIIPEKERILRLKKGRDWAGQSMVANRDIPAGTILRKEMIDFKRPGRGGLPSAFIDEVTGKRVIKNIEEDEQILMKDLE
ncbi:MAG: N-acetylneuraminate synthase family protein [Patescibacteria group bacterium]